MASSTTRSRAPSRSRAATSGRPDRDNSAPRRAAPNAAPRQRAGTPRRSAEPKRAAPAKRRSRPARSRVVLRWLAVGGVLLAAFLYVRPLRAYLHTRSTLEQRTEQVQVLRRERSLLERRAAASHSAAAFEREARRLGYVKPGERLYIVTGIRSWRRAQHGATMRRGG
jgi:cell division protein FtsB